MEYIRQEIIPHTPGRDPKQAAVLEGYLPDVSQEIDPGRLRPAVLVLPGGAYAMTSETEGEPVALKFAAAGACAFLLWYSVAPARFPQALCEVLAALRLIRQNAALWNIDPERVAVCGFSAGGHLAASAGVFWDRDFVKEILGRTGPSLRPDRLILCYPVLGGTQYTHRASMENLLGESPSQALPRQMDLYEQVDERTPETFLWHTAEDECVPPMGSLLFAQALLRHGVACELHLYPRGGHGLSLGNYLSADEPFSPHGHTVSQWFDNAVRFLYE